MNIISRIKNLFRAARLLSMDDSENLRVGIVSGLGKDQAVRIFTPYGIMHHPPENSLVLTWGLQAQESNLVGMADDPDNRTLKNMAEGEVALGNYTTGNYIYFDQAGICHIVAENLNIVVEDTTTLTTGDMDIIADNDISITGQNVTIDADDTISITADVALNLNGTALAISGTNVGVTGSLTNGGTNIGSTHIHSQGTDSNGDTEQDTGTPHS